MLVGSYSVYRNHKQPMTSPIRTKLLVADEILKRAARIFSAWPNNIGELFSDEWVKNSGSRQVERSLRFIYPAINRELKGPHYMFFLNAFNDAVIRHWPEIAKQKNARLNRLVRDNL